MSWRAPLFRWSLKRAVLTLLLPTFAVIGAIELWATYRTAVDAANSAYDRSLLGAIKAIDANISTESGGVAVELPYTMLEFFELTAAGEVYFRVGTENGLIEIGSPDLPRPPHPLQSRVPQFYDAVYFGQKVRVGTYARNLESAAGQGDALRNRVIIQVAETLKSRSDFISSLLLQGVRRDLILLTAAGVLLALVLSLTLRPLSRLRDEVRARSPLDLTPIDIAAVPVDVRPLVEAINLHMARTQAILEGRRRFLDDASHQLRTPLATLRTQFDYALREQDPTNVRAALQAVSRQLNRATRRTNQMLSLAKADAADLVLSLVDLAQLARRVAGEIVIAAREKKIDLELVGADEPLIVHGHADLLREAALNLLHNAIRFAPESGRVSLQVARNGEHATLAVIDNGPGIPEDELPRMGERFFQASNAHADGSGLGLAIARAVLERHGGVVTVANRPGGAGCVATLALPLTQLPSLTGS
ncbi:MAG TPA: sensor histidine kinase N-terminal domain-containing protein [Noviherbaspirillum sp.]|nr:sensor histidine kinase N-terminal domain-containing protein [Noviherbaspirillum sp.]